MCPTVTVSVSYRHARAAIDWLAETFGFERHAVYPGPGDTILHAELTLGTGMIMIGTLPERGTFYGDLVRMPDEVGGYCTQSINLVVPDPDAVCGRAKAAGAVIVSDIEDKPYGGRGFSCRDPEGHLWHVGSYDPWAMKE
ncbi:VOC family protein [Azospirillum sp. B4]|uniref:VOC family protein n=1 Tax=Azospirillum sp. B4 TaxID=95605 RepID=UPI0003498165|nr:VOC family protein [Azospirillum sp. B4]